MDYNPVPDLLILGSLIITLAITLAITPKAKQPPLPQVFMKDYAPRYTTKRKT